MSTQPLPVGRGTAVQLIPADFELPLQDFSDDMLRAIDVFAGSQSEVGLAPAAFDLFDTQVFGPAPAMTVQPVQQAARRPPPVRRHERNRMAQRRSRERARVSETALAGQIRCKWCT